jgi:hypothetical protein
MTNALAYLFSTTVTGKIRGFDIVATGLYYKAFYGRKNKSVISILVYHL